MKSLLLVILVCISQLALAQNMYFSSPPAAMTSARPTSPGKKIMSPDEFSKNASQINAKNKTKEKQALKQEIAQIPPPAPPPASLTLPTTSGTPPLPSTSTLPTTVSTPAQPVAPLAAPPMQSAPVAPRQVYTGFPTQTPGAAPQGVKPAAPAGGGGGGWNIKYR